MDNILASTFGQYLKDNLVLVIVLAVILLLIIALSVVMIVLQVKAKKQRNDREEAETPEAPAEEESESEAPTEAVEESEPAVLSEEPEETPAPEEPKASEKPAEREPEKAPVKKATPKKNTEQPKATKPTPYEVYMQQDGDETADTPNHKSDMTTEEKEMEKKPTKAAPAKKEPAKKEPVKKEPVKKETKPAAAKPAPAKKEPAKKEAKPASFRDGKWIISKSEDTGRFTFELYASNKEMMIFSGKEYSTLASAKSGIETYKNAMNNDGYFKVIQTKAGDWIYRLFNNKHTLLATSSNYSSESNCQKAVESTKNFAKTAIVEVAQPKKED